MHTYATQQQLNHVLQVSGAPSRWQQQGGAALTMYLKASGMSQPVCARRQVDAGGGSWQQGD
jgi:hypothetical protein